MNKVILLGRMVRDAEVRDVSNNKVGHFTVAVDGPTSKSGERTVDFVPCVAWNKTAEFVDKWFTKGSMIALEGRLSIRQYETKEGSKRTMTEVVVDKVYFAGSKSDNSQKQKSPADSFGKSEYDDEIPF